MAAHRKIRLYLSKELRDVLEARRITEEDVQKTIVQAEATGRKFVHPRTGRFLAGVRPYFVTFWVEYSAKDEGFEVHSAYQHRVKITSIEKP